MKSLHYALANLFYYKRTTLLITSLFSLFLLFMSAILNLRDLNLFWLNQLIANDAEKNLIVTYQNWNTIYSYLYIGSILLFTLVIGWSVAQKLLQQKNSVKKWRLLGFSKWFILKQALLELTIMVALAILFICCLLLICQNLYGRLLFHIFLAINGNPLSTAAPLVITENIPASATNTVYLSAEFLSWDFQNVSLEKIFDGVNQNIAVLTGITLALTTLFTGYLCRKSKVFFRK